MEVSATPLQHGSGQVRNNCCNRNVQFFFSVSSISWQDVEEDRLTCEVLRLRKISSEEYAISHSTHQPRRCLAKRSKCNVLLFVSSSHVILGLASELPIPVFSFILDAQTDIDRHADNCLSDHMHVLRRVPKKNSSFFYMLRVFVEVEA